LQGWIARPAGARWAEHDAEATGEPQRRFADFRWTTKDSWSRRRRVVAKAEWMPDRGENGANPRFVITSLEASAYDARTLYEQLYCARGSPPRSADRVSFGDRIAALLLRDGEQDQGVPARPLRRFPGVPRSQLRGVAAPVRSPCAPSKARRPSILSIGMEPGPHIGVQ